MPPPPLQRANHRQGLSYTTFKYSGLKVAGRNISVAVTNTGPYAGAEVAQLYLGFPASAGEPLQVLRGFEKLELQPGATQVATFALGPHDTSVWSVAEAGWSAVAGQYDVRVGASSRDIRLKTTATF